MPHEWLNVIKPNENLNVSDCSPTDRRHICTPPILTEFSGVGELITEQCDDA